MIALLLFAAPMAIAGQVFLDLGGVYDEVNAIEVVPGYRHPIGVSASLGVSLVHYGLNPGYAFQDGKTRVYDVSDPSNPVQVQPQAGHAAVGVELLPRVDWVPTLLSSSHIKGGVGALWDPRIDALGGVLAVLVRLNSSSALIVEWRSFTGDREAYAFRLRWGR